MSHSWKSYKINKLRSLLYLSEQEKKVITYKKKYRNTNIISQNSQSTVMIVFHATYCSLFQKVAEVVKKHLWGWNLVFFSSKRSRVKIMAGNNWISAQLTKRHAGERDMVVTLVIDTQNDKDLHNIARGATNMQIQKTRFFSKVHLTGQAWHVLISMQNIGLTQSYTKKISSNKYWI